LIEARRLTFRLMGALVRTYLTSQSSRKLQTVSDAISAKESAGLCQMGASCQSKFHIKRLQRYLLSPPSVSTGVWQWACGLASTVWSPQEETATPWRHHLTVQPPVFLGMQAQPHFLPESSINPACPSGQPPPPDHITSPRIASPSNQTTRFLSSVDFLHCLLFVFDTANETL
jgi:hypothetical protein